MSHNDAKDHTITDVHDGASRRVRSDGNVSMPPELFEKLYLQPQNSGGGELRKILGNPAPLGLTGFVMGLTPLSCALMGWRGAGSFGAAVTGVYYYVSGPLLIIAAILEFILGNTFPFVVFGLYGGVFMALSATLSPEYGSATIYSSNEDFYSGMAEPGFYATLAYLPVCVASMHVFFLIASTRVNAVFFGIFLTALIGFGLFAGALWKSAEGSTEASSLMVAAGAFMFVCSILGWYLLGVQILASTGFPLNLPVGDFSKLWDRNVKELGAEADTQGA